MDLVFVGVNIMKDPFGRSFWITDDQLTGIAYEAIASILFFRLLGFAVELIKDAELTVAREQIDKSPSESRHQPSKAGRHSNGDPIMPW